MLLEEWDDCPRLNIFINLHKNWHLGSCLSLIDLKPIADFEELYTFAAANPTPVVFSPQNRVWQLEAVAARIVEGVAVAAHEPLLDVGYPELARILLEHTEYLYTYPEGEPRPRLEAGSALALAGCVCAALPQSELWRLAGFGRVAAVLAEVAPAPTDVHLTRPLDVAFLLAMKGTFQFWIVR